MIIRGASVFQSDATFTEKDIFISGECFSDTPDGEIIDAKACYAIPGLIDLHFHGCMGYDFCDATEESICAIAKYEAQNGITSICPATMTFPEEKLTAVCKNAAAYHGDTGAELVGINMEGPFISLEKKGAQNGAYVQSPDAKKFRRLQKLSGGLVKLLAIAPEEPGAMEMIDALKDEVVLSLAHTTADYDTASEAYRRGASQATHLYNAMPPFTHRAPGVVGAALDADNCRVELICDGVHIHPCVVRATFRMFGEDRLILISDSMMATGLPNGKYSLGGQEVTMHGNKCTLVDGTIAGSATNLMDCLRVAVKKMDIPLATAVKCATINPAKAIGIYDKRGSIEVGKHADLVLLNRSLDIVSVFIGGNQIQISCK